MTTSVELAESMLRQMVRSIGVDGLMVAMSNAFAHGDIIEEVCEDHPDFQNWLDRWYTHLNEMILLSKEVSEWEIL